MSKLAGPPTRHPITEAASGFLTFSWLKWFETLGSFVNNQNLADTHANRANYAPANYAAGSTFYETDRKVSYIQQGGAWIYLSGEMMDIKAHLPGDLGANDAGFHFFATDYVHLFRWTGAAWIETVGQQQAGNQLTYKI